MGAIEAVHAEGVLSYIEISEYRRNWVQGCKDYRELSERYPDLMSIMDWLHGVENAQFSRPMLVAMYDGETISDITTSIELDLKTQDVVEITKWCTQTDKLQIWSDIYALMLTEYIFIHRLYTVEDESYLVGFLLPKDEANRLAILDVQSRYIKQMLL